MKEDEVRERKIRRVERQLRESLRSRGDALVPPSARDERRDAGEVERVPGRFVGDRLARGEGDRACQLAEDAHGVGEGLVAAAADLRDRRRGIVGDALEVAAEPSEPGDDLAHVAAAASPASSVQAAQVAGGEHAVGLRADADVGQERPSGDIGQEEALDLGLERRATCAPPVMSFRNRPKVAGQSARFMASASAMSCACGALGQSLIVSKATPRASASRWASGLPAWSSTGTGRRPSTSCATSASSAARPVVKAEGGAVGVVGGRAVPEQVDASGEAMLGEELLDSGRASLGAQRELGAERDDAMKTRARLRGLHGQGHGHADLDRLRRSR